VARIMAFEGEKATPTMAGPERNSSALASGVMRTTPRRPQRGRDVEVAFGVERQALRTAQAAIKRLYMAVGRDAVHGVELEVVDPVTYRQ